MPRMMKTKGMRPDSVMRRVSLPSMSIACRCEGEPEEVSAVFIHGAGGSHRAWMFQFEAFRSLVPCLFLDLPGHGQSTGSTFDSIELYAGLIGHFLEELHISRPILIGHSMGSAILLQVALSRQDLTSLVLVGGGARLRVAPAIIQLLQSDYLKAATLISCNLFASERLDTFFEKIRDDLISCGQQGLLNDFAACDRFDVMTELSRIVVPTLAVVGSADTMTPPKYSHYLSDTMGKCVVEVIDQAGHMVMAEQPETFNEKLGGFISRCVTV